MSDFKSEGLQKMTLRELLQEQTAVNDLLATAKACVAAVQQEVAARLGGSGLNDLAAMGKTYGTVTLELQDKMRAKVVVDRKVKWDGSKLLAVAQTMPWDKAMSVFKLDVSMSETAYKGVAMLDADLKAKIDDARTEIIAPPKVTLEEDD